jgi:hypothetical protein
MDTFLCNPEVFWVGVQALTAVAALAIAAWCPMSGPLLARRGSQRTSHPGGFCVVGKSALEAAGQGCLHCRGEEVSSSKIKVNNPTLATTARMGHPQECG